MLTYFFRDGGSMMYAIAAASAFALLAALVACVLHALRRRLVAAVWLIPLVSVLLAGTMGVLHGRSVLETAFRSAAAETLQTMVAHGLSIQLYTDAFSRVMVMSLGVLLAVAVAIGHQVGTRGENGRWTLAPGLSAGILTLLGAGLALALAVARMASGYATPILMLTGVVAFLVGLAVLLTGLRADADDARIGGTAGARAVVWIAGTAAIWAAAGLPTTSGIVVAFKAVATAAAEHKAEMLQAGVEYAQADGRPGLFALGAVVVAGPLLLLPCVGALRKTTGVLGAAAAAVVLLAGAGGATINSLGVVSSFDHLSDMFLPEQINDARVHCAPRASRPGIYTVDGKLHRDGTVTELRISFVEGASSEPTRECLRAQLEGFSMEDQTDLWGGYDPGYEVPPSPIEWRFEMPPGDHVLTLARP